MGTKEKEGSRTRQRDVVEAARTFARDVAVTLEDSKADEIEAWELVGLSIVADFFVVGSGYARVQIQALADKVLDRGRADGTKCRSVEGYGDSGWILLDFGQVVVHLMTHESRDYYRLDRLWGDAPHLDWKKKGESKETE